MLLRILTAAVLIPVVIALVWYGPPALLAAVAAVVAVLAVIEFFDLGERVGLRAFRKWTIVCSAGLFYAQYSAGFAETRTLEGGVSLVRNLTTGILSIEQVLLVFLFGSVVIGLATRRPLQEVLPAVSIGSAALLFIALPFSYLVRINEIKVVGRHLVLFTLSLIWAGDMLAYFVGRSLGRIPMAPALSPKKTWEGALGNLVASLIMGVSFARWMEMDMFGFLVMAGSCNLAGQMGDLVESAYKRGAAVKGSSSLLPGHGGHARSRRQPHSCRSRRVVCISVVRRKIILASSFPNISASPIRQNPANTYKITRAWTRISILGCTGSIGRQCLSVVDSLPGRFEVVALAGGSNVPLIAEQIASHRPKLVSVATEDAARELCACSFGIVGSATRSKFSLAPMASSVSRRTLTPKLLFRLP